MSVTLRDSLRLALAFTTHRVDCPYREGRCTCGLSAIRSHGYAVLRAYDDEQTIPPLGTNPRPAWREARRAAKEARGR